MSEVALRTVAVLGVKSPWLACLPASCIFRPRTVYNRVTSCYCAPPHSSRSLDFCLSVSLSWDQKDKHSSLPKEVAWCSSGGPSTDPCCPLWSCFGAPPSGGTPVDSSSGWRERTRAVAPAAYPPHHSQPALCPAAFLPGWEGKWAGRKTAILLEPQCLLWWD